MSDNPLPPGPASDFTDVGERNMERLLGKAYKPEGPDPEFIERLREQLTAAAQARAQAPTVSLGNGQRRLLWLLAAAAAVAALAVFLDRLLLPQPPTPGGFADGPELVAAPAVEDETPPGPADERTPASPGRPAAHAQRLTPRERPGAPPAEELAIGKQVQTGSRERRRLELPDGSVLYLNHATTVRLDADRQLTLSAGEVFVEVAPKTTAEGEPVRFLVKTPQREVVALGTRFAVRAAENGTGVTVTQGKVQVSGLEEVLLAGQQLPPGSKVPTVAPRAAHLLDWTRELMCAAEAPLVPPSKYQGGALVVADASGQQTNLSLRKYHIDVHVEDGFARTTIDQTYFNHTQARLEGTFHFPLPQDASISRLAMYVNGTLMEGGMAERDHARQTFETIVRRMQDPALLEWVDSHTFKMRVFPLEPRQEKRIVLSYTQRLPVHYGRTSFRFPAGHSLEEVRDWSLHVRVKGGGKAAWVSDTHGELLTATKDRDDLVLEARRHNVKVDGDIALDLYDGGKTPQGDESARFSSAEHEGARYLMLRYRPALPAAKERPRRDWVFLFESSGDRDPLLARVGVDVVRTLLANAEHDDTFAVITAGTRAQSFAQEAKPATAENARAAVQYLEGTHLIGALDLEKGLAAAEPFLKAAKNPFLVHVGSGFAALGETRNDVLAKRVPAPARYVGVGIGKRWNRALMKAAAERTGGFFTQINPDDPVGWRTFELYSTLTAPRLLDVKVVDNAEKVTFLTHTTAVAQGEEVCAIARLDRGAKLPESVAVSGVLDGKTFTRNVPVKDVRANADYLPRTWAKLEIERLLAENAQGNKARIVQLSMAMYVMTPYTSLLVLENEEMYRQYNVDRGRKDHWALYPCPNTIPVVHEPVDAQANDGRPAPPPAEVSKPSAEQVLGTVVVRVPPRVLQGDGGAKDRRAVTAQELYGGAAGLTLTAPEVFDLNQRLFDLKEDRHKPGDPDGDTRRPFTEPIAPVVPRDGGDGKGPTGSQPIPSTGDRPTGNKPTTRPGMPLVGGSGMPGSLGSGIMPPGGGFGGMGGFGGGIGPGQFGGFGGGGFNFGGGGFNFGGGGFNFGGGGMIPGGLGGPTSTGLGGPPSGGDPSQPNYTLLLANPITVWPAPNNVYAIQPRAHGLPDLNLIRELRPVAEVPNKDLLRQFTDRESIKAGRIVEATRHVNELNGPPWNGELLSGGFGIGSLLYRRPTFAPDGRLFRELLAYAPGLNTTRSDILAVLEAEAAPDPADVPGTLEPAARALIEGARGVGWQTVAIPATSLLPGWRVAFDGSGRYAYERVLPSGLKEQVVCDGKELLHLYPELGLGARRSVSRFHRAEFAELVPWALPPAKDLVSGADVKCIAERIVALLPRRHKPGEPGHAVHLVFAADGKLAERRLVETTRNTLLRRETYAADGTVRTLGADGKELSSRKLVLQPGHAADLDPDLKDLVVLPMPLRSRAHIGTMPSFNGGNTLTMDDRTFLALMAAYEVVGDAGSMMAAIRNRCFNRGDTRIGLYTLLLSAGWDFNALTVPAKQAREPVARYIAWLKQNEQLAEPGSGKEYGDGLLRGLTEVQAALRTWQKKDGPITEADVACVLKFVREAKAPVLVWAAVEAVLKTPNRKVIGEGGRSAVQRRVLEEACAKLKDVPGLSYAARYEHARHLLSTGKRAEARQRFAALYEEAVRAGARPPLDRSFREALEGKVDEPDLWSELMRDAVAGLVKDGRRVSAVAVAWQCWELGSPKLANELLAAALAGAGEDGGGAATLAAVEYLGQTHQYEQADKLLQGLLANPACTRHAGLWRLGYRLALQRKQPARAFACLAQALEVEYRAQPPWIDLEAVRREYGALLAHYERTAEAHRLVQSEPPSELVAKVVRAADRWRALDVDGTAASQAASRVLRTLDEEELAWEYLLTAVAAGKDAVNWHALAQSLQQEEAFDLADRAYAQACVAEPANVEPLWGRANNLLRAGKPAEARVLFRQIAEGTWAPQHAAIQEQARRTVEGR